ncbi:helix-turn-helix transcriptional regulator [Propionivibrio limicola]|uniref:helix-turn-helix transcriptional regulator n=1 Tax=Propionivibrio limicola TaxID=167645 RepID=UPI00129154CB|nr:helix-turn-helix transcriptional regulator [Propionivibrio limicola]
MPTLIETPQHLGDAVRRARKALGLTQPQLALAAGVGVRFIVDLEAGKPTVRLENVLRVLQALGATLSLAGLEESQK